MISWVSLVAALAAVDQHPCTLPTAIAETEAFLATNRSAYDQAISRGADWLGSLDADPVELRQHGIKGKKKLVELLDGYYRIWTITEGPQKAALFSRIKHVVAVTYEDRYHDMLNLDDLQFKQDATSYLRAALLMDRLGLDTTRYRQEIARIHARLNDHMAKRGPHQRRAFHWYYEHFGLSEPFALETALEEGIIARRLDPSEMTSAEAYELTHEIFGPYEYGDRLDADPFNRSEKGYLSFALDTLAARYLKEHDPDLLAEVVSCMRMLRFYDLPHYRESLSFLLSSQEPDGSWRQHRARSAAPDHDLEPYQTWLHTTVVAIGALALSFHAPWNEHLERVCF